MKENFWDVSVITVLLLLLFLIIMIEYYNNILCYNLDETKYGILTVIVTIVGL